MHSHRHNASRRYGLSRRSMLQIAGAGSLAGVLGPAGAVAQTPAAGLKIPDAGAELPQEAVTLRMLVQGPGPRSAFYEAFIPAYQEARPQISVQLEELPEDQIRQVLPIAVQDGQAHDIFQLGGSVTTEEAVAAGWVAPLDDLIPDFEAWKAAFPPGVFVDGITVFDGKTYTFPLSSNRRHGTMLFANSAYMEQAGIDPTAPMTWDVFRSAARDLTTQGNGQYFGMALGSEPANLAEVVTNLGTTAGAASGNTLGGPMDWATGEYVFASDEYLAAIDLLIALQADGSLLPGTLSLTEREAMETLPRGTAAMILDGPWVISRLAEQAPDFRYGLDSQPLASEEAFVPLGYAPGGANEHFVSATSDLQQVAGDVFAYWGSVAGQSAVQSIVGGALLAIIPEAQEAAQMDEASTRAMALFEEQMRLHPDPRARNPDIGKVYLEYRRLQPNFGETIQGILSGQIADTKAAMEDLASRADQELERAITAAQEKGAQVSRDDFVFANWDPTTDYADEQYGELE